MEVTTTPADPRRPTYAVRSTDNALRALQMLRDLDEVRVSEVAERLHIGLSTAHRVMSMLVYRGFASQVADRRYIPGPALRAPVIDAVDTRKLVAVALPPLQVLADELDETVNIALRIGMHTRVLASAEPRSSRGLSDQAGTVLPAHRTAAGRALLALEPSQTLERLFRGPDGQAELSQAEYASLLMELTLTRRRGFALCNEEALVGISALAVAMTGPTGQPFASAAVVMPTSHLGGAAESRIIESVFRSQRSLQAAFAAAWPIELSSTRGEMV